MELCKERIVVELAPARLMPHAVHVFLHAILENFASGKFHRAASHVLQASVQGVNGMSPGMAFQEYS